VPVVTTPQSSGTNRPAGSPATAQAFDGIRCLVARAGGHQDILIHQLDLAGLPTERIDDLDRRVTVRTSFDFANRSPHEWATHVNVPTLLYSVKDDVLVDPRRADHLRQRPGRGTKLFWIEGTTRRWDGYQYFQKHPEQVLDWFATHIA